MTSELFDELSSDVHSYFCQIFGDEYGVCFPPVFIDDVIDDVMLTSAFAEGHYNDTDIQYAVARTALRHLGVCV